ncbi:ArsA-related P-loop ATPase [Streptomyces sp. H10-C2]|uniref:ArsA family ATPase n=1 Tax=unclassified Streptomyces TaxID=2593676 RepID=UPI0024B8F242|nr:MULTISPECIES: ArsA-related P-loop ATPase [unclassified Streptomyces]MDJ0341127.1 ArsA-related P-loop ATPase [Streptomyces sp. PH10-H1]MDJ0369521.1 ArsA-related P-loop ATPase [Streptomyces sp. H10-C2]
MRTVLVTGPGGAGRTTAAAATAVSAARQGARTLLLSTDRGASLDTVLDGAAAAVPGLRAHRIDTQATFRADARDVQSRLGSLLDLLGAEPLDPEELTELPGADSLALLRALRESADGSAGWDVVVVDLPATPAALAALALPEQLRRYLARLVPVQRQAARALRPVLAQLAGVPMPAQWAYEAAERADRELAAAQAVVEAAGTTVRLVVEPGAAAADAIRTARTGLALFGHRLEAVVANRLLPDGSPDPWLADLSRAQHKELAALRAELAGTGTAVHELPHLGREPRGAADLTALAAVPPGPQAEPGPEAEGEGEGEPEREAERGAPLRRADDPWTVQDQLGAEGHFRWRLPLPGATREGLGLVRRGDELVIDAEGFRRILPLPSGLRRCTVSGAALRDGALDVRFAPDPDLWPR